MDVSILEKPVELFFTPIQKYLAIRDEIEEILLNNRNKFINNIGSQPDLSEKLQSLSAKLVATANSVIGIWGLSLLPRLRFANKKDVLNASRNINRLSYFAQKENHDISLAHDLYEEIAGQLKIKTTYSSRSQF